ncbi:MAG: SprT family zinc-dependent metalloprotease, partial [Lacisediminimonas sp.]|nr:SprT family zinc-dependent metalloprotease [Lacisediminimonas sp.]
MKKLLRHLLPQPLQLALQLDFFTPLQSPPTVSPPASPSAPAPAIGKPAAPAPGRRRIQLHEHALDYTLRRSKRRSIGFVIDDDGLHVAAPRWVTLAEIEGAIREKERWVFAKLAERRERSARLRPPMAWRDGACLPYLGGEVVLRIATREQQVTHFDAERRELLVCLPGDAGEQQLKDQVLGWLQREARRVFAERLPLYAEKLGVEYRSFALSSALTQWGSCTADGRIRLNWRLMHFGLPQIDYVIA